MLGAGAALAAAAAYVEAYRRSYQGNGVYTPGWTPSKLFSPWPRTDFARIQRMNRYVEWKRMQIELRRVEQVKALLFWTCGPPILAIIIGLCWRGAAWVITNI